MGPVSDDDMVAAGDEALASGRWADARRSFELAITEGETARACFGLAAALWWSGENREAVTWCTRAYVLFRQTDDVAGAVQCAVWLAITYKANFANAAAANGWTQRAERLVDELDLGPLHGWTWVARAYRSVDLDGAQALTERAVAVARRSGDVDLELVAQSQLGLIRVSKGEVADGFALIDEAMAATLAGERSNLDAVVYISCDMLNACELANDLVRAGHWCAVADQFVATYGCPFLYAECRIYYGSVLMARGRWNDAERELTAGLAITADVCPGLHVRALTRLAMLRVRQGRLEDAEDLLSQVSGTIAEPESALCAAALLLAGGDPAGAAADIEQRLDHIAEHAMHIAPALALLVEAALAAGDLTTAALAADRLSALAETTVSGPVVTLATRARGDMGAAAGDLAGAARDLESALAGWVALELPYEAAVTLAALARVVAASRPSVAVEHARGALATFETLGAVSDADRVAAFLRSMGVVPRIGAKRVGTLTGREQDVLRLLGSGLSNPQIAERLHISRKTAAHHVSHILGKLHLDNRAAAAVYATREWGS